jgi:mono/diheme cytochrome c family protein
MHKAMLIASAAFLLASNACRKDGGTQPENTAVPDLTASAASATLADPPPADPPPAADGAPVAPAADGAAVLASRCTVCHTTERVLRQASRDRAWWTGVVDKMIGNGARLDDAEKQALLDYLVSRPAN